MSELGGSIEAYGAWRGGVAEALRRYGRWLADEGLADAGAEARLAQAQARLAADRLSIAFVAEFSRGKSELINAIFFASYGQRMLPSAAGRTTMCPTELLWDPSRPPGLRLLPIESRLSDVPLAELRDDTAQWHERPFDPDEAREVREALQAVCESKRVVSEAAALLGLWREDDPDPALRPGPDGQIEVPRWRHAIVNLPHPLLARGLVVVDTPGLNAIGAEPELTLNLIPSCDAVLFVLAADAGVSRTDAEVWREHVNPTHRAGRLVVLNKIDGLWDDLSDDVHIELEIARQVSAVSRQLDLPPERVFPVSAQKGLVGKVQRDAALLRRSRLPDLERALSAELVPQQRELAAEHVGREFDALSGVVQSVLAARRRHLVEQLFELNGLRGKNRSVVEMMATRIRRERVDFEKSLRHLQALRAVFTRHSQHAYAMLSMDRLRGHVRTAREAMRAARLSGGMAEAMRGLLSSVGRDIDVVGTTIEEINTLMTSMYRTFAAEHGLALGQPTLMSVRRYREELERIEALVRREFGLLSLVTTERWALMRRFLESVASRLKALYELANREIEAWLRAVIAPIEGQVREHQSQLKRRIDSVRRVLDASGSLDARIAEIEESRAALESQLSVADELAGQVRTAISQPLVAAREEALA